MLSTRELQTLSAEFFGTFMLSLIIAFTGSSDGSNGPIAIGFGLVVLVFITGPISGGQLNPAVTIGLMVRQKLCILEGLRCIFVQLIGGLLAGLVCYGVLNNNWSNVGYPSIADTDRRFPAFIGELLQTFALVTVVLGVATTKSSKGKSYFGLAIGFVVLSGAITLGGVTGGCFNPAVSMLTLLHGDYSDMWVYILCSICGSATASFLYPMYNPINYAQLVTTNNSSNNTVTNDNTNTNTNFNSTHTSTHTAIYGFIDRDTMVACCIVEYIGSLYISLAMCMCTPSNAENPMVSVCVYGGLCICVIVYMGDCVYGGVFDYLYMYGVCILCVCCDCVCVCLLCDCVCEIVYMHGGFCVSIYICIQYTTPTPNITLPSPLSNHLTPYLSN